MENINKKLRTFQHRDELDDHAFTHVVNCWRDSAKNCIVAFSHTGVKDFNALYLVHIYNGEGDEVFKAAHEIFAELLHLLRGFLNEYK
ncbi:MAG: hypothetical protein IKP73_00125 [Bacteroidales bacterium]|nr:hypothetical protein [Bacteroidales bacterium]